MKSVAKLLLALAIPALVLGEFGYGKPRVPEITAGPLVADRSLDERAVPLTIGISNNYGAPMSIEFDHNAGGPEPIEGFLAPRQLGASSSTQFAFPTGWAGVSITPLLHPKRVYTKAERSRAHKCWQNPQLCKQQDRGLLRWIDRRRRELRRRLFGSH